jgi:FlaA1/EpsC-like NDP-sugar epimerase
MTGRNQDWDRFLSQSLSDGFRTGFAAAFAGQSVCVAGAGGFIGSPLVRALAQAKPRSLVLLDSSEYSLFRIQRWMETEAAGVACQPVLGSVGDDRLLDSVFTRFGPQTVFHAAAFKHVGLLERNPFAAIANNALGSYSLSQAALRHGVSKLVLVSTDKAVHPHSVMGVSKRIAELLTLSFSEPSSPANAIRLGNVIGSTGSVGPLFLEQIQKGQPISVTHPEASRYFLSLDETVTAILAAGSAPCEGKVLLPEFADPVRIAELASFLASGTAPLRFTGLQPGEKVTEDLIGPDETPVGIVDGPLSVLNTRKLAREECERAVERLSACVANRDVGSLLEALLWLVPEYKPSHLLEESAAVVSYE